MQLDLMRLEHSCCMSAVGHTCTRTMTASSRLQSDWSPLDGPSCMLGSKGFPLDTSPLRGTDLTRSNTIKQESGGGHITHANSSKRSLKLNDLKTMSLIMGGEKSHFPVPENLAPYTVPIHRFREHQSGSLCFLLALAQVLATSERFFF